MHELSIAQNIVDVVVRHLPDEAQVTCRAVRIRLGPLSGVVPESLEFCFGCIVDDTPLRGARLDIEHVPARATCTACGETFVIEDAVFSCPSCGATDLRFVSGMELEVVEVEVGEALAEARGETR